jgi:hypothetical protein
MEDIIGFEDQIGANFLRVFNKAIKRPIQAAKTAVKTPIKTPVKRAGFFSTVKKQTAKGAAIDKNLAQRIAKGMPIPAKIRTAIVKRQATGKPLPPAIKKAVAIKKTNLFRAKSMPFNNMPTRNIPTRNIPARNIPTRNIPTPINPTMFTPKQVPTMPITAKALTMITNPTAVKSANPVQRSFMPVDLPYKNFAPKTKRLKIPATNFSLSTSIDLVQPSVDGGTNDYYGK